MNGHAEAFGVYVHWPFCAAKCPYCDFNSHVRHNGVDQAMFLEAYLQELSHMAGMAPNRRVTSIFFGGGTPSLMEPKTVESILNKIAKHWEVSETVEITMEANPSSVEAERFAAYRSAGVNRVSLGVQALNNEQLKFLGRLHSVDEALTALDIAKKNFDRVSFDLIYARPDQTLSDWEAELSRALELAAGHLSLYQLTIEHGTRFFDLRRAGKIKPLEEEEAAKMYELTQSMTGDAGYQTYEISNHALPGHECAHNLVYWRGQDYVGVGPGAHGRIWTNEGRTGTATERHPETWWQMAMSNGHGITEKFVLDREEVGDEFLIMGLRLKEGISHRRFEELSGRSIKHSQIEFLKNLGFIEILDDHSLRATPEGFLVLDAVVADLAAY